MSLYFERMGYKYYWIWIEGLSAYGGEKIKSVNEDGSFEYTLKVTEALRIKEKDLSDFKELMAERIADWVYNNDNTYIPTRYAPKGTIWKNKN